MKYWKQNQPTAKEKRREIDFIRELFNSELEWEPSDYFWQKLKKLQKELQKIYENLID